MRRMGIVVAMILAAALCAAQAQAQEAQSRWYWSAHGGLMSVPDARVNPALGESGTQLGRGSSEFDTGFRTSVSVGRAFGPLRVEGEAFYGEVDFTVDLEWDQAQLAAIFPPAALASLSGDALPEKVEDEASLQGLMLNGWYDFALEGGLKPYVGGGAGLLDVDASEAEGSGFAWQVGAGLGYQISENMALDVGYRYLRSAFKLEDSSRLGTFTLKSKSDDVVESHSFSVGLRFRF